MDMWSPDLYDAFAKLRYFAVPYSDKPWWQELANRHRSLCVYEDLYPGPASLAAARERIPYEVFAREQPLVEWAEFSRTINDGPHEPSEADDESNHGDDDPAPPYVEGEATPEPEAEVGKWRPFRRHAECS